MGIFKTENMVISLFFGKIHSLHNHIIILKIRKIKNFNHKWRFMKKTIIIKVLHL